MSSLKFDKKGNPIGRFMVGSPLDYNQVIKKRKEQQMEIRVAEAKSLELK